MLFQQPNLRDRNDAGDGASLSVVHVPAGTGDAVASQFQVSSSNNLTPARPGLLMLRLRPGKHRVVLRREHFDQHLVLFWREYCPAATGAGVFAGEVVGERVSVPVSKFVVGAARGKSQDQLIVLDRDFQGSEVFI